MRQAGSGQLHFYYYVEDIKVVDNETGAGDFTLPALTAWASASII